VVLAAVGGLVCAVEVEEVVGVVVVGVTGVVVDVVAVPDVVAEPDVDA